MLKIIESLFNKSLDFRGSKSEGKMTVTFSNLVFFLYVFYSECIISYQIYFRLIVLHYRSDKIGKLFPYFYQNSLEATLSSLIVLKRLTP